MRVRPRFDQLQRLDAIGLALSRANSRRRNSGAEAAPRAHADFHTGC